jgi:hypothetical protein
MTEEIKTLLEEAGKNIPGFSYNLSLTFFRQPFEIDPNHPLVSWAAGKIQCTIGKDTKLRGESFWTDCVLLADAGLPCLLLRASGLGLTCNRITS